MCQLSSLRAITGQRSVPPVHFNVENCIGETAKMVMNEVLARNSTVILG